MTVFEMVCARLKNEERREIGDSFVILQLPNFVGFLFVYLFVVRLH